MVSISLLLRDQRHFNSIDILTVKFSNYQLFAFLRIHFRYTFICFHSSENRQIVWPKELTEKAGAIENTHDLIQYHGKCPEEYT